MNTQQRTTMICCLAISLFISSCGAGQLFGPTLTPAPTFAPEKLMVVHTITLEGIITEWTENVFGATAAYAVPLNGSLVGVYYKWGDAISVLDLNWIAQDEKGNDYKPIGYGLLMPNTRLVVMKGNIRNQNCTLMPLASEQKTVKPVVDPLLVLVFIVPTGGSTLSLLSPQGQTIDPVMSSDWLPSDENKVEVTLEAGDCDKKWIPGEDIDLVHSGISTAAPTRSGPPTYSEVLRTYPRDVQLCKTAASIEGIGAGEENWLLKGDAEIRDNQMLVKCYGTKITVNVPITIGNQIYAIGTKLTVDKDLNWIEVSSWELAALPVAAPLACSPIAVPTQLGGDTGRIVFLSFHGADMEIYVVNADGSGLTNLTNNPGFYGSPAWSPDGTKIAFPSTRDGNFEIYVMCADGSGLTRLTNNPEYDGDPAWSPDGTKIAFSSKRDGNLEIYVMNADGSGQTNLTNNPQGDTSFAWSPNGKRIAFVSHRDGNSEIYVMNADGSEQINLTNNPNGDTYPAWSPDGTKIAFQSERDGNLEIYIMKADGSEQTNLTNNPQGDTSFAWSPDGTKIVFDSTRDGNYEIYVMNADGSDQTNLTNNPNGDTYPAWSPDGTKIAFQSSGIKVMNANGSGQTNLTNNPDMEPAWQP